MNPDLIGAVLILGASFVVGISWGLYLNLTHWHRMRRWATRVCDVLDREEIAK